MTVIAVGFVTACVAFFASAAALLWVLDWLERDR
jgi:hypothetical protein